MPELQVAEPEKFPEVVVREWPKSRLLLALGYWCIKVARRDKEGGSRPRFSYTFRMHPAELHAVMSDYFAHSLKIDARTLDDAEQVLIKIQESAGESDWIDPDA